MATTAGTTSERPEQGITVAPAPPQPPPLTSPVAVASPGARVPPLTNQLSVGFQVGSAQNPVLQAVQPEHITQALQLQLQQNQHEYDGSMKALELEDGKDKRAKEHKERHHQREIDRERRDDNRQERMVYVLFGAALALFVWLAFIGQAATAVDLLRDLAKILIGGVSGYGLRVAREHRRRKVAEDTE